MQFIRINYRLDFITIYKNVFESMPVIYIRNESWIWKSNINFTVLYRLYSTSIQSIHILSCINIAVVRNTWGAKIYVNSAYRINVSLILRCIYNRRSFWVNDNLLIREKYHWLRFQNMFLLRALQCNKWPCLF